MKKLYGITTAMVTPFDEDDRVDLNAVKNLTEMLIERGVHCLFPCGTTGEMLKLNIEECQEIAKTVVRTAKGRATVYIQAGAMRLDDVIELAQYAQEIGADGIGVVTPQFFSVNDREMEEFYVSVANSVKIDFPVYLYNIPQCSSNDLKPNVINNIVNRCKNVVGIKYSWADMGRTLEYLDINNGNFSVLHGCDKLLVSLLDMGCDGVVSGCAGIIPEPFVAAYSAYISNDMSTARKWGKICVRIVDALKAGSNMSYFKEALTARGLDVGNMRKPQLNITEPERDSMICNLKKICAEAGIEFDLKSAAEKE